MEFYEHLKKYLNDKEIAELETSLNEDSKHALLLNSEKMSQETLFKLFPDITPHPIVKNAFIYDINKCHAGKLIYLELGCYYLQEPSAMVPAFLLNPSKDDLVLDLCAAPGGKSMQASLLMENKGLIIANDISRSRINAVLENAERMGRGNLLITNNDFSEIYTKFNNTFDKIILDAPCSGSGMFRKDKKMVSDWTYQKVLKCAEMQKNLILMAYQMLKPGGTMVYSTCSFSYEEDEVVIQYLLDNSDATLEHIKDHPLYYKSNIGYGIHLFPYKFPGEGHYIALIKKPGELKKRKVDGYYLEKVKFGDYLFTISEPFPTKNLRVVRYGVKIGQVDKNDIRYDYHYAHFISSFERVFSLDDISIITYYLGNTIDVAIPKGYVLLQYKGINVDIAKSDGRIIKNRLPKGLRRIAVS